MTRRIATCLTLAEKAIVWAWRRALPRLSIAICVSLYIASYHLGLGALVACCFATYEAWLAIED